MTKWLVLFSILLVSCSKDFNKPDELLQFYVKEVTSKKLSRTFFEKYTAKSLKDSILSMNKEDFESFQEVNLVKNVKVDILNESCVEQKCHITYLMKYTSKTEEGEKFESEVKKIAELLKFEEHWKIIKISNIKTFHEGKSPIHVQAE